MEELLVGQRFGSVYSKAQTKAILAETATRAAPRLLGSLLVRTAPEGTVALRITEVEAYEGTNDPGSHAFNGLTPRTQVMFEDSGLAYVYFTYGMHYCLNVVCGPAGVVSAVLLRAGEIVEGEELAILRRPAARRVADLARGPARLTAALNVNREFNGANLLDDDSNLRLMLLSPKMSPTVVSGPRIGVSGPGGDGYRFPWRYWIEGDPTVSRYRAARI